MLKAQRYFLPLFCTVVITGLSSTLCISQDTKSSSVIIGGRLGITASRFSASINAETRPRLGPALGLFVKFKPEQKFRFTTELLYSNQVQQDNYLAQPGGPSVGHTTTSMHYINIPLLLETGTKVKVHAGPQLSFLISGTEKGTVRSNPVNTKMKDVMKATDFGLSIGAEVPIAKGLSVAARGTLGLTDIYEADEKQNVSGFPDIKNRVATFFLAYTFNGR